MLRSGNTSTLAYKRVCGRGNHNHNGNHKKRDEILAWSDERKGWEEVGKMKEGRDDHAITTINVDEVTAICG